MSSFQRAYYEVEIPHCILKGGVGVITKTENFFLFKKGG